MIEQLEFRRLFSAISLHKHVLVINGTEGDDVVTIERLRETDVSDTGDVTYDTHLLVTLNGTQIGDYSTLAFNLVKANLMGGDDSMIVGRNVAVKFDIDGGDGNDTISGGRKSDTLRGGTGDNLLVGGEGNDDFICDGDSDTVIGGNGNDTADFSNQTQPLSITLDDVANDGGVNSFGDVSSDVETIVGGQGADTISAAGIDHVVSIVGGGGDDRIFGGLLDDTLKGGTGNDDIHGGTGDDYINGNAGTDKLFGEAGNDTLNGGGPDPTSIPIPTPAQQPGDIVDPTDLTTTLPDATGLGDDSVDELVGGAGNDSLLSDAFDVTSMDITPVVSHPEGNSGMRAFRFRVTLDAPNNAPITVDYVTADGTATVADNDYVATSGTLTFAIGQTSKTITVEVNGDTKVEPDETFFVNLTNIVGSAAFNTSQGKGLIVNDD